MLEFASIYKKVPEQNAFFMKDETNFNLKNVNWHRIILNSFINLVMQTVRPVRRVRTFLLIFLIFQKSS